MEDIMNPPHGRQLELEDDWRKCLSNHEGTISFGIEFGRLVW